MPPLTLQKPRGEPRLRSLGFFYLLAGRAVILLRFRIGERQIVSGLIDIDIHHTAFGQFSEQQLFGQRLLHVLLDDAG